MSNKKAYVNFHEMINHSASPARDDDISWASWEAEETRLHCYEQQVISLKRCIEAMETESAERKRHMEKSEEYNNDLIDEVTTLKQCIAIMTNDITAVKIDFKELERDYFRLEDECDEFEAQLLEARKDSVLVQDLVVKNGELVQKAAEAEEEMMRYKHDIDEMRDLDHVHDTKMKNRDEIISFMEGVISSQTAQIQELKTKCDCPDGVVSSHKAEIEGLSTKSDFPDGVINSQKEHTQELITESYCPKIMILDKKHEAVHSKLENDLDRCEDVVSTTKDTNHVEDNFILKSAKIKS